MATRIPGDVIHYIIKLSTFKLREVCKKASIHTLRSSEQDAGS
jgi:hypothetical protein